MDGPGDVASVKRGPEPLEDEGLRGEWEPTHTAGPCLEDGIPFSGSGEEEVHKAVYLLERNGVDEADILVYSRHGLDVWFRVEWSPEDECYRVAHLAVRSCGESSGELLKAVEWPEVSRAAIDRGCVEIVIPLDPPYRAERAIKKLGLNPGQWRLSGLRPVSPGEPI